MAEYSEIIKSYKERSKRLDKLQDRLSALAKETNVEIEKNSKRFSNFGMLGSE